MSEHHTHPSAVVDLDEGTWISTHRCDDGYIDLVVPAADQQVVAVHLSPEQAGTLARQLQTL